jgi:cytoskeleton-associated protein 5
MDEEPMAQKVLGRFNNTNKLPNTFKGNRGGSAEDEDLLAELKAISMKNDSGGRFGGDDNELPLPPPMPVRSKKADAPKKIITDRNALPRPNADAPPPPWKKNGPSTIPAKSRSVRTVGGQPATQASPMKMKIELPPKNSAPVGPIDDILVVEENVSDHIDSKNWKLRKASYDILEELLEKNTIRRDPANDMQGHEIHQCVSDKLVPQMAKDSNASALDSALRFVFGYIDYCAKGCDPSLVISLVTSIITGPALSATRPSTSKSVDAVLMKIMQVSRNEPSSIHIVVEQLLDYGITSKKPKVVVKSARLILDAAKAFGAATLPLAKVTSNANVMLSHVNGEVRETGINVLAEICRAVGSKDPLSDIIETMKTAQVSELDSLLISHPIATPPLIGLRYAESMSSFTNALEILQAGAEESAAEDFAAREPVNVFNALRETEYKSNMKGIKWSEKVGALDILLQCGGQQPYKLVQPSKLVNYNALISEIKKLLSHTHFAVKSKAMLALGMLAEGVGDKLFPHLRPLLTVLLELSKDKKVTRATISCLDSFFDNVIGFSHLLDKEDSLASFNVFR